MESQEASGRARKSTRELRGTRPALIGVALLGLCGLIVWLMPVSEPRRPNVILLSIDTLRADHLSLYGYERETSPNLERLAEDAVVFDRFFNSGGGTLISHTSLMTSLYPDTHGVNPDAFPLNDGFVTAAEVLRDHGYETAAFTDSGWLRGKFGFRQGFELYDDTGGHLAVELPKAERWLTDHGTEPFFLFVHTYDTHSGKARLPYDAPDDFDNFFQADYKGSYDGCIENLCGGNLFRYWNGEVRDGYASSVWDFLKPEEMEYVRALYDGGIRYMDEVVGGFVETLKGMDLYDDTLLIVLSDHGEEFGEHNRVLHGTAYEEFIHIPLLIKFPGSAHSGTRVTHLASMVDVLPTMLGILDVPLPPLAQGSSLQPTIERDVPVRDFVISHRGAIRDQRWKLIAMKGELYDLRADPEERVNLLDQHPELVERFAAQRQEHVQQCEAVRAEALSTFSESIKGVLTADDEANLRALGYLD